MRRVNQTSIDGCLGWTVGELVRLKYHRFNRANDDADERLGRSGDR